MQSWDCDSHRDLVERDSREWGKHEIASVDGIRQRERGHQQLITREQKLIHKEQFKRRSFCLVDSIIMGISFLFVNFSVRPIGMLFAIQSHELEYNTSIYFVIFFIQLDEACYRAFQNDGEWKCEFQISLQSLLSFGYSLIRK